MLESTGTYVTASEVSLAVQEAMKHGAEDSEIEGWVKFVGCTLDIVERHY